jgi:hypothetical protein
MTDYVSRTDALTVACPYCKAEPGYPCMGARDKPRDSSHKERQQKFTRDQRERRFYDVDPNYIPDGHHDTQPARQPEQIPDDDRTRGLVHCRQILEQLAARGHKTGRPT